MTLRLTLLAICLALCAPVFADEPATPAPTPTATMDPKEQASLLSFGVAHPECKEWSDGCAVCLRDNANVAHCSTPGIACLPVPIACKTP